MIAPVDVTGIRIETDRLILRAWRETDLEDFYEYARVDGVGQMAGWQPHKDIEESRKILGFFIAEKKTLALELKENGKVIGSIGLEIRDADLGISEDLQGREIGYVLSKDYWGRGLMPEAVKAVIDHCFYQLRFDWLTCGHFVWNNQSRRVVEKCGFEYVKDVVHQTRFGTEEPTKLYVQYNPRKMTAPFDVTDIRIETERLFLRPWRESDLDDLHEIATDPEVTQSAGWKCSENLEDTKIHLLEYMERRETFAVVLKENGKAIGSLSLQARNWAKYPLDRTLRGREFGFDLNRAYWGRGLMPEAVKAVTAYCFDRLGFDFLSCGYFRRNARSAHVTEKCGFKYLFDAEFTMNTGVTEQVRTHILYNPHKEK